MPFDGSGNYVVPAGTQGVPGTVIDSTKYNTLLSDLQTALTLCVTRNGQSAATANLPMGGFKLTGLAAGLAAGDSLRWEQLFAQGAETAIASAATLDIGAVNSSFLRVTGSTGPITSLGTNYNGPRFLRFIDTPTLTHNASTLILPTGANIIAAAGDTCIAIPKATSTNPDGWVVLAYQRATGGPLLTYVTPAQLQAQTYTAFTTAGTATAFTLTPTPAITAYAENQEFDAEFHTASSGTPTLNISAVAAKSLKYRDSTGTLVSVGALIPSGWRSKVVYDGTDLIVREMPTVSTAGDNASTLTNATFAISVAANAITIALKTKAGTDPSASDPVTVGFRHATLTDGTYVVRTITAALSLVVPSGATLGFSNSETNEIHIGFIDNAGTVELAVSQDLAEWTEGNVVSTTAIGTGSDSDTVLYSTSARTNVACRLAQVCTIQTGGTAGNWSNSPTVLRNVTNYGSAQLKNACQAWINFNGVGSVSIRDHFNVASLTDNSTGDYTITFNVAQPDANYCVTGTAGEVTGGANVPSFISPNYNSTGVAEVAPSTTAVRVNVTSHNSAPTDCKYVYVLITGRGK